MQRIPRNYRVAGFIMLLAVVMASLFALSYGFALGRPQPRRIPIGTIGSPARAGAVVDRLQALARGGLEVRRYGSLPAAQDAVEHQRVYAVVDARASEPRLLISSASATSVSRTLQQLTQKLPRSTSPQISDLHPLQASDPQGRSR